MDRDLFRLIIVIIGLLVMAGIYFFDPGRRQQVQGQKPWYDQDDAYSNDSDVMEYIKNVDQTDSFDTEQHSSLLQQDDQDNDSEDHFSIASEQTPSKSVPESNDSEPTRSLEQELLSELNHADTYDDEDSQFYDTSDESELNAPFTYQLADNIDSDFEISDSLLAPLQDPDPDAENDVEIIERPTIVMLYLINTDDTPYQGKAIADAFTKAGLRYGSTDIFYAMDYQLNKELFSVANMHEPGTFPEQMTYFETEGIILFMQPMTLDNPLEVYEKMVACADVLYKELGGEILDDKRQPITQAYLDQQRKWLVS
jgi:cell division protein ZipA